MVKKILRRISPLAKRAGALIGVIMVLCCCLIPASATVIERPSDGSSFNELVMPLQLERFSLNFPYLVDFENPLSSVAYSEYHNRSVYLSFNPEENDNGSLDLVTLGFGFGTSGASRIEEVSGNYFTYPVYISFPVSTNSQSFSFSSSETFVASSGVFYAMMHSKIVLPGYTNLDVSIAFNYRYPVSNSDGSGYDLVSSSTSFYTTVVNESATYSTVSAFPDPRQFSDDFNRNIGGRFFLIDSISITYELENFHYAPISAVDLVMVYGVPSSSYDITHFLDRYPVTVTKTVYKDLGDVSFTDWLTSAVGGFLDFEIFNGVSFGAILTAVVGLSLLVLFFKFFGG